MILIPAYRYPRLAAYIRACLALNKSAGLRNSDHARQLMKLIGEEK